VDSLPPPPPPPPPARPPEEGMFINWERPAVFPGCEVADNPNECTSKTIMTFLYSHIKYPKIDACFAGTVILSMEIMEDGHIGEVRVRRGIYQYADKEALRAVLQMKHEHPKWTPARFKDRPMAMTYFLPVRFKLE
ncbi:MAG: energy transducer TonB, partial [Bacteroidota bacterium]